MRVDLKWLNFNSERMEMPIWQRWFCSVGSPCIAEAIHWSQPSHKVEKLLSWKFGVSAFCFCKVILKTSSVTAWLQCLCCQPTIYRRFVDILPRYDLFWWLVPEKIAFCLQRSGSKYRYFIWAKRSSAGRAVMVHSARHIALLLASFDVTLPSESKKPSRIDWTIEISPSTRWFLLGWFPARMSRWRVSHCATYCDRRFLTSCRPAVHTCSHFGARVRRPTCRAGPRARHPSSLNILTAREPMGPSSRRQLIFLASHCIALARERKKPSRIAREIEIFSIFAGWVPTLVPKHNSRFRIFRHTLCWSLYSINIYETFGRNKIAVSLWNQNGMVSYTWKDSIRSPECLAYWSWWLEVSPMNRHWPGFDSWQFAPQAEQCRWAGNCKFYNFFIFKKLEILNQVLI